jgi:hypothetical protein
LRIHQSFAAVIKYKAINEIGGSSKVPESRVAQLGLGLSRPLARGRQSAAAKLLATPSRVRSRLPLGIPARRKSAWPSQSVGGFGGRALGLTCKIRKQQQMPEG